MGEIQGIIRIQWSESDDDKVRKFIADNGDEKGLTALIELIPYRTYGSIKQRVLKFKYEKKVEKRNNAKVPEPKMTPKSKLDNLYLQLDSTGILDPNYSELLNQINNLEITVKNKERWK